MKEALEELYRQAEAELIAAAGEADLLAVKTKYLGRKGLLTAALRQVSQARPM